MLFQDPRMFNKNLRQIFILSDFRTFVGNLAAFHRQNLESIFKSKQAFMQCFDWLLFILRRWYISAIVGYWNFIPHRNIHSTIGSQQPFSKYCIWETLCTLTNKELVC